MARKNKELFKLPKWEIYQHKDGFERVLGYSNSSFKALYEGRSYDLHNVASAVYGPGNVVFVSTDPCKLFRKNKKKFCTAVKSDYISFRAHKR